MHVTFPLGLILGWAALRWWNIPYAADGQSAFPRRLAFVLVSTATVLAMEQHLSEVTVFAITVIMAKTLVGFLFLFGPQIGGHR